MTYVGKNLSNTFPTQTGIEKGHALSLPLFNFALEYAIKNVQENQVGLKLNGTHRHLAYADDLNLLGDNIETTRKNIGCCKEIGLEVNI
jgi:hypothetical protein